MLVYGVHQPNYKSDEAVIKFANRLALQGEIYRLEGYSEATLPNFRYTGNSMPGILLFNSKGQLTKFELDCSGGLDSIVQLSTNAIDHMSLGEKSFEDFINDTYVINSTGSEKLTTMSKPLYVIKFAEYAGLLNKDSVPGLVSLLESRNDVDFIILNVDYTVKK
jgi:hypothetical protein